MNEIDSLTQPAGPLSQVTLWGHPYHGLVTAPGSTFTGTGTLDRGGGFFMDYRVPDSADAWAISLDGVPAVTRTSGEAAADAAVGFQWLDKVVVSGSAGQVYGKYPGSNAPRWYWRDAAGKVWCITVQNTGGGLFSDVQIEVRRFGVIGQAASVPRDHTLAHALAIDSTLWAAETAGGGIAIVPRICDIKPDGRAAIICVAAMHPSVFDAYGVATKTPWPFGFVEISLSTGGDGWPVPSLTTLRDNDATLGTRYSSASTSSSFTRVPVAPGTERYVGNLSSSLSEGVTGRILSVIYGSGGTPVDVTCSYTITTSLTENMAATYDSGGAFTHTQTHHDESAIDFSGSYAGAGFMSFAGAPNTDGVTDLVPLGDVLPPSGLTEKTAGELRQLAHSLAGSKDVQTAGLPDNTFSRVVPHAYTHRVFGQIVQSTDSIPPVFAFGTVHHPSGTTSGGASHSVVGTPPVYRSYNPITGTLSPRSAVPVCYV